MTSVKKLLKQFAIFTLTSLLAFILGSSLGWAIVLMDKFIPDLEFIPNELLIIAWSLWWGVSAYSLLFRKNADCKYTFQRKMSFYTFFYGAGIYLALFMGEKPMSANIFAITAICGLLLVLTAPPFIEKYLKHTFIQRAQ